MITFQFHRGDKFLSKLIRVIVSILSFGRARYNHVSIRVGQTVYEAMIFVKYGDKTLKGVIKVPYSKWKGKKTVKNKITIQATRKDEKRVRDFLNAQVGKKYDITGFLNFVWIFLPPAKGKWFCSELAKVAGCKLAGIKSSEQGYNQKVTPDECKADILIIKNLYENN